MAFAREESERNGSVGSFYRRHSGCEEKRKALNLLNASEIGHRSGTIWGREWVCARVRAAAKLMRNAKLKWMMNGNWMEENDGLWWRSVFVFSRLVNRPFDRREYSTRFFVKSRDCGTALRRDSWLLVINISKAQHCTTSAQPTTSASPVRTQTHGEHHGELTINHICVVEIEVNKCNFTNNHHSKHMIITNNNIHRLLSVFLFLRRFPTRCGIVCCPSSVAEPVYDYSWFVFQPITLARNNSTNNNNDDNNWLVFPTWFDFSLSSNRSWCVLGRELTRYSLSLSFVCSFRSVQIENWWQIL